MIWVILQNRASAAAVAELAVARQLVGHLAFRGGFHAFEEPLGDRFLGFSRFQP
jgi:hypothetical protein